MQFYGTVTTSCLLWQERYGQRSSSCRGFPLLPESSDLLNYGVDVGVTEVSFSCWLWKLQRTIPSFLSNRCAPQRQVELQRHFLTWDRQTFPLEDNIRQKNDIWKLCEPPKDNFFLTIIPRKYSLFKAPSSRSWVCMAALEKQWLALSCCWISTGQSGHTSPLQLAWNCSR